MPRHHITHRSTNKKTGPMTVTRTTSNTCPPSCPLLGAGCYDEHGNGGVHRRRHDAGAYKAGQYGPAQYFAAIEHDPQFSPVYRHNEGGDLWGDGDRIDEVALVDWVAANRRGKKSPIVYTHKPVEGIHTRGSDEDRAHNAETLRSVRDLAPFAINVSCDTPEEAQRAVALGFDATLVTAEDAPRTVKAGDWTLSKGDGPTLVGCPAAYDPRVQCSPNTWGTDRRACGGGEPLCLRKGRGYVVTFPAHGQGKRKVNARIAEGV